MGVGDEDFAEEAIAVGEPEAEHAAGFEGTGLDANLFEGFADGGVGGRLAGFDFAAGRVDVSSAETAFFFNEQHLVAVKNEAEHGAMDGGPVDPVVGGGNGGGHGVGMGVGMGV
ncbi:MAG: hypothetical protein RIS92_2874 [Verrucomicrobiota bacterium]